MMLPRAIERWLKQTEATFKAAEAYLTEATKALKEKNKKV